MRSSVVVGIASPTSSDAAYARRPAAYVCGLPAYYPEESDRRIPMPYYDAPLHTRRLPQPAPVYDQEISCLSSRVGLLRCPRHPPEHSKLGALSRRAANAPPATARRASPAGSSGAPGKSGGPCSSSVSGMASRAGTACSPCIGSAHAGISCACNGDATQRSKVTATAPLSTICVRAEYVMRVGRSD